MGKGKKGKKYGGIVLKPQPLSEQIISENEAIPSLRDKHKKRNQDDAEYVDGTLGQAIIKQSLAQLRELNDEDFPPLSKCYTIKRKRNEDFEVSLVKHEKKNVFKKVKVVNHGDENSDDDSLEEFKEATPINVDKAVNDFEDHLNLNLEELSTLEHFKSNESSHRLKFSDILRDKITEKHTELQSEVDNSSVRGTTLKPEIIAQCKEVGEVLHKYRSGPLPKMLKTFPIMSCWEELLLETFPENWSAAAMYQVTRLFISNLPGHLAQRFCANILLPRIRDDISYYKRLNFHLYQALTKALFKSGAFFKGIIFPLCQKGDWTLRESIIICSILANNHVPINSSAAAILKVMSMNYHGGNFIFLRVLFDKRYALPYMVIEETVKNFLRYKTEEENYPILWHQALLSFVQRYKNDLTTEQKRQILELIKFQTHYKITPQIRKEIEASSSLESMDVN